MILNEENKTELLQQKEILISFLRPAIDQFVIKTGLYPDINIIRTEEKLKCGMFVSSEYDISVKVVL